MHDREANRTYRDCTAVSKYLSAVGPSERGECLLIRHLNRSGVMPFWLGGLHTSAFGFLAGKIGGVSKIGRRRHMQGATWSLLNKECELRPTAHAIEAAQSVRRRGVIDRGVGRRGMKWT